MFAASLGWAQELDFSEHERLRREALEASLGEGQVLDEALNEVDAAPQFSETPPQEEIPQLPEPASEKPKPVAVSAPDQQEAVAAPTTQAPATTTPAPSETPQLRKNEILFLPTNTPIKVHGELRTSAGFYSNGDVVFTRANADLNERNYRLLSTDQLNRGQNTFDPALYSRLKLLLDAPLASELSYKVDLHLNITNDPWSYTGKTGEVTVTSQFGDQATVRYLYWGNTGYTVNQIVFTSRYGNSFALPELKVTNGTVPATTALGAFFPPDTFQIPAMRVDYNYFPLREAWVDVTADKAAKLRIFPIGYENQALTSNDPLGLSNHRQWWEESPWLWDWRQGILNTGAIPVDFTKGQWDRSLSFFTRDSDGTHLTALRGVSLDLNPTEQTSVQATVASPKTLWQDFNDFTALPASLRAKHFLSDNLYLGGIGNAHQGFVSGDLDAENYVGGVDAGYTPIGNVKLSGEVSTSKSHYDQTTPDFAGKRHGNAYYGSIQATNNGYDLLNRDYFGIVPYVPKQTFYKSRLFFARMDEGFETSLSNYHATRRDSFWSRHLTFYPSTYRYLPGIRPSLTEYDLEPFAVGDGIDYGRQVYGFRGDVNLLEGRLQGMGDVRRVARSKDDQHIETVSRTQWTLKPTDAFTAKLLFVDTQLPKTTAGLDPFITDGTTGKPLVNTTVVGGEDPSLRTGSLGARYQMTGWSAINGVWEYTNDWTESSDNFPRGNLNSASFATYTENGNTYREVLPFLYSQGFFPQAPYEYHNIFKAGLEINPTPIWHIYLDYTRNPNKFAGNIDDNMNHWGIETAIIPSKRFGFFARYTFSRWYDLENLVYDLDLNYKGYHNVFVEGRYVLGHDDWLSLSYGVGPAYNVTTSASDPDLAYYATTVLSTQHLVRLVYQKKF